MILEQVNAINWIEALLSGKYKQGYQRLGSEEDGFCCWGLGCKTVGIHFDPFHGWNNSFSYQIGYKNVYGGFRMVGVQEPMRLNRMNDVNKYTFKQIAYLLIKNAHLNFYPDIAEAIQNRWPEIAQSVTELSSIT